MSFPDDNVSQRMAYSLLTAVCHEKRAPLIFTEDPDHSRAILYNYHGEVLEQLVLDTGKPNMIAAEMNEAMHAAKGNGITWQAQDLVAIVQEVDKRVAQQILPFVEGNVDWGVWYDYRGKTNVMIYIDLSACSRIGLQPNVEFFGTPWKTHLPHVEARLFTISFSMTS